MTELYKTQVFLPKGLEEKLNVKHYIILGKDGCGQCELAQKTLTERGDKFEYVDVTLPENELYMQLFKINKWTKVPQIFKNSVWVGSFQDLRKIIEL